MNVNTAKMIGDENYKEKLTLLPSNHMLGACSVKLVTPDNITIGYSGDFSSDDETSSLKLISDERGHSFAAYESLVEKTREMVLS